MPFTDVRSGGRRLASLALLALLAGSPLTPATIVVEGDCSLADAIISANTNQATGGCPAGSGADLILLTGDISLTSALPIITTAVTIDGQGFEVRRDDGAPEFRILEFDSFSAIGGVANLTVRNGVAERGGGLRVDMREFSMESLTVVGNQAIGAGAASAGGGIEIEADTATLINSTIADNVTDGFGGGIYLSWYSDLAIEGTTVSGNHAGWDGGGINFSSNTNNSLVNSTVSGNSADRLAGGIRDLVSGYYGVYPPDYGIDLIHTTITGNSAPTYGGVLISSFNDDNHFANTIIAGNSGDNCSSTFFDDQGGNFDDDGSCALPQVVPGADFDLALTDNGGPTRTHALLRGSVAVEAGVDCSLTTDQRGFPRSPDCDSGSVELGAAPVGGSIEGLAGIKVKCENEETLQSVLFDIGGSASWDCEAQGLLVSRGDRITQTITADADSAARGSVIGLIGRRAACRNQTTATASEVLMLSTNAWDCEAAGLTIAPGDRVVVVLRARVL